MLELPTRLGGLKIVNPKTDAAQKFKNSKKFCKNFVENLFSSDFDLDGVASGRNKKENERCFGRKKYVLLHSLVSTPFSKARELVNERSASNWLTTLPLEQYGFAKQRIGMLNACDVIGC